MDTLDQDLNKVIFVAQAFSGSTLSSSELKILHKILSDSAANAEDLNAKVTKH